MDDLRTIMTKDLEKIRQQLLEAAIRSGVYQRNDKLSTELFPTAESGGNPDSRWDNHGFSPDKCHRDAGLAYP